MKIMRTPRSVDLDITSRCNLRCRYCYHFSGSGDVDQDLPKIEWLRFFEELNRCAVMNVVIAGGEPFFREDFPELIAGIVSNRMRFSILSNGTLVTDEMAAFLFSTGRCDGVQVSIDGSKPETHDACRGKGSFRRALEGISCLKRNNVTVDVRVTVHRHNVTDLEAIAALLLDEIGLPSFSTNAASYLGLCRQNLDQIGLLIEDRTKAMKTLLDLNLKYDNRISAQAGPLAEATWWTEMELAHKKGKKRISTGGFLTACGCVMDNIAVRADGIIVPCTMLSHMELGRINRDDLKEIWQRHPSMQRMRER
ncbi:MAG: SynChlorMet cassette radical SAM/SPASM protein ScmE, partial [Deltaproteobacteria bacterium]|nr:SynChlorMet cassette radical SAM/SPASM protein ScmE [Deltaproteobacteria bacterium]